MEKPIIIRSDEINFIREGYCKRCGACEKPSCPHFKMVDGLATCDVYDKRDEVCHSCFEDENCRWYNSKKWPVTHSSCKNFPNSPFARVVREGICGYKFRPLTKEDDEKYKRLLKQCQT